MVDLPTAIIPNKTRFFLTVTRNFKFDFSQLCLIFQCKYNLIIMQLRLQPRARKNIISRNLLIKTILIFLIFFLGIFLLDKIDFPTPTKPVEQEISNDKLITLK
tara:strand:- start:643 stop:954 length:312 start_codon:yes stop_codon:yes gene_type:complete